MHVSFNGFLWRQLDTNEQRIASIAEELGVGLTIARCIATRCTSIQTSTWLSPSIEHLHDPFQMLHMDAAVDRLSRAIRERQHIRVVTDYDVDGTTSSLILQAALKLAADSGEGAQISYHIPDRFRDGYGFSVAAVDKAKADGVDLIVTADIGVRDHGSVLKARECGIDVLICDHHLPEGLDVPPDALVLCPPQHACHYPNRSLAACGISLKVAQALLHRHPKHERWLPSLMKLAAIGTIADLVPITTLENRAIVSLGLQQLNQGPHSPGLEALLKVAGLTKQSITTYDIGFRIAPRINAAGRVADAKLVVELLTERDGERAGALADRLNTLNDERKSIQLRLADEAAQQALGKTDPFIVLWGHEEEGWHRGVVGIVAARVREIVHRPVAIVSIQGELAVGSVRSVPGVHAVEALTSVIDLLEKFGGHPVAAGFTIQTCHLESLKQRLGTYVENCSGFERTPIYEFDDMIPSSFLTEANVHAVDRLGPFGQGNLKPRFVLRNLRAERVMTRQDGRMLKFEIGMGFGQSVEGIWWNHGHLAQDFESGLVDILGELSIHVWNGRRRLQFQVLDGRKSA